MWPASCRFAAARNGDLALVASATRVLRLRNALQVWKEVFQLDQASRHAILGQAQRVCLCPREH